MKKFYFTGKQLLKRSIIYEEIGEKLNQAIKFYLIVMVLFPFLMVLAAHLMTLIDFLLHTDTFVYKRELPYVY